MKKNPKNKKLYFCRIKTQKTKHNKKVKNHKQEQPRKIQKSKSREDFGYWVCFELISLMQKSNRKEKREESNKWL